MSLYEKKIVKMQKREKKKVMSSYHVFLHVEWVLPAFLDLYQMVMQSSCSLK